MKLTFPHLGNTFIAAKIFFDSIGIDYVIPPENSKIALELGSKYSPEEICLPFKLMVGNYIQSIEEGADTVLIVGSCGPCRFGEYCELQINLLKKLGYSLDFIVLDYTKDIGRKEFINRGAKILSQSKSSTLEKISAGLRGLKAINLIDAIEAIAHSTAGYEVNKGECKHLLNSCRKEVIISKDPIKAMEILKHYKAKLENVTIDKNRNPLKIAIMGEIYTVIDSYPNLFIEEKLMDYGVSSYRKLTPSWWVKDAFLKIFNLNSLDLRFASKAYLPYEVGGHGRECIGEAVIAEKNGLNGAIQIFPLGCMPEIVSKAILPTISKEKDFPIMTLVVDEMTGENGYITRIEAFIDMLERRNGNVLYGC